MVRQTIEAVLVREYHNLGQAAPTDGPYRALIHSFNHTPLLG
jgi:hypothetical protein